MRGSDQGLAQLKLIIIRPFSLLGKMDNRRRRFPHQQHESSLKLDITISWFKWAIFILLCMTLGFLESARKSAEKKILFLRHAISQMNRPERMISTREIRNVIFNGIIIEEYPSDPRGKSCLILGWGDEERPIHVVCSPKKDYLAIITAYVPDGESWDKHFKERVRR